MTKSVIKNILIVFALLGGYLYLFQDAIFYPEKYERRAKLSNPKPLDRSITTYVVADLGGMRVRIPDNIGYISWVNWNGQANDWDSEGYKIKYQKTHLRSFSFEIRYPDMTGSHENDRNMSEILKSRHMIPHEDGSFWIKGGVISGDSFRLPSDDYFKFAYDRISSSQSSPYASNRYLKSPSLKYGMEVFELSGIDTRGVPFREGRGAEDVYYFIEDGKAKAYGECPVRPKIPQNCSLKFTLLPKSKSIVTITFNHSKMGQWKEMMEAVRNVYFNFEIK